jgi:ADP-heptose:LPS heptosyltransferase
MTASPRSPLPEPPTLVVLRALGLGDFLTGVPALRALAAAYPQHRRLLAAPVALAPLVALSGCGFRLVDARPRQPLPPSLGPAAVAVNLHGRGPESHRLLLAVPEADPGRRLIAFAHPDVAESSGLPAWRAGEHEIDRWCRLLSECGIPADPQRTALRRPDLRLPARLCGATVIHPGAGSPARRWPPQRWAEVARRRAAGGDRVILTGDRRERPLAWDVARRAGLPAGAVLAGRTDLGELASLVSSARLVLSADTGIAHLAAALGTPAVTIFGPTPPAWWAPRPGRPGRHRGLWAGSTGDPHATTPDPGMLAIGVEEVLEAAGRLPVAVAPYGRPPAPAGARSRPVGAGEQGRRP